MGKKKLAVEIVWSELLFCGGEWRSRKQIYEELLAEGLEKKYVDWYLFCLSEHQPTEEERLKTLHVTASTGPAIELCSKCREVKQETTAFFKVSLSPGDAVIDVPFRPMYYCQCERMEAEKDAQTQPAPMSELATGSMVHYVSSTGRHEASVVIEIFDAVVGHVKLRNLCNLLTYAATYSETPTWDSWHWIEKDCTVDLTGTHSK